MMQTLVNQNFPPTDIIQLSGHKNLQSVTHYSTVNESQQMEMSRILSSVATGTVAKPARLVMLCKFKPLSLSISLEIDSFYSL